MGLFKEQKKVYNEWLEGQEKDMEKRYADVQGVSEKTIPGEIHVDAYTLKAIQEAE